MANSNTCILGYDPGGDGKHGVAVLHLRDQVPTKIDTLTLPTTEAVIEYFSNIENIHAIGVDTLYAVGEVILLRCAILKSIVSTLTQVDTCTLQIQKFKCRRRVAVAGATATNSNARL